MNTANFSNLTLKIKALKSLLSKLSIVGLSLVLIAVLAQQITSGNLFKRGPEAALASRCDDNGDETCDFYDDNGVYQGTYINGEQPSGSSSQGPDTAPASAQGPATQGPQTEVSCPDDLYYEDNGRKIHKHGGYFDGNQCVYAFDDVGLVEQPQPQPEPEQPQGNPTNENNNNNDNRSQSRSDSSSRSNSESNASIRNNIDINNSNYQTQSQTLYLTQMTHVTRETVRPTVSETTVVKYDAIRENVCPQGTTRIESGATVDCVVQAPPQQVTQQVVYQQPQVVTVSGAAPVKELPKTGLPLAGLALAGLTPLGLRLRKIGSNKTSLTANYIWEERALNRN